MGYYTNYDFGIQVNESSVNDQALLDEFRETCEGAKYAFGRNGRSTGECKWYSAIDDLLEFSTKHPLVVFRLEGEGEEHGDSWKLYVQTGCKQECRARIVYPEFDLAKLRSDVRETQLNKVIDENKS